MREGWRQESRIPARIMARVETISGLTVRHGRSLVLVQCGFADGQDRAGPLNVRHRKCDVLTLLCYRSETIGKLTA